MKFFWSIVVYVLMGAAIGWGILETFKGNFWILPVAFLAYLALLTKIGCLPPKGHH